MAEITHDELSAIFPSALRDRFNSEARKSVISVASAQRFQRWFESSGLPFFPDYTDHTFGHSLDVLRSASDFIAPDAAEILTGTDLATLTMACCCHDAGMHLTEKQFIQLITNDLGTYQSQIDVKNWKELWRDYEAEARRFNAQQLMRLFGDETPVRPLPDDPIDYSKRDRLLIGEFIRRHHPRLAHEIAKGLDQELGLERSLQGLNESEADLIGIIARSHGLPLRSVLPYLEQSFDLRDFQGCHAVFLMVLLRIADYTQIQSARAPEVHGRLHDIRSPISAREWRVHQSINNINNTHSDPEAIYIDARPKSVSDLTRVKAWLNDLQSDLDISWAVLGEVYGRHTSPPLDTLRLKIRRIRSNLLENSGQKLDFVPEALSFRVAETQMLSLLLAPLYGDNPIYGLRELVQNARDAALEAVALGEDAAATPPRVQVTVSAALPTPTVSISDNGIGMSFEVIRSYFLNAGASYRSSDDWRATFESVEGRSTVARSGRFGVGALAAFLIGDNIEVTTRHFGAPDGLGYHFKCRLTDREIEVRRVPCEIGTTITVETNEKKIERLIQEIHSTQDIFHFTDISLQINAETSDGKKFTLEPGRPSRPEAEKLAFSTDDFPQVEIYLEPRDYYRSQIHTYVNGIAIANLRDRDPSFGDGISIPRSITWPINIPSGYRILGAEPNVNATIYVQDPDAIMSLNLARTGVTKNPRDISDSINRHLVMELLSNLSEDISIWTDGKNQTIHHKYFKNKPGSVLLNNGRIFVNDTCIAERLGIKIYCRIQSDIQDILEQSLSFPDVIFISGSPPEQQDRVGSFFPRS